MPVFSVQAGNQSLGSENIKISMEEDRNLPEAVSNSVDIHGSVSLLGCVAVVVTFPAIS